MTTTPSTTPTILCMFPGCDRPAAVTGATTGRPSGFCDLPGHNAGAAYRARSKSAVVVDAPDQPVTAAVSRAGGLRDELVKLTTDLATRLTQVAVELESMADPEKAVIEIEAIELKAAEELAAERSSRAAAQARERSAVEARIKAHGERDLAQAAADEFEADLSAANVVHDEDMQALVSVREELAAAVARGEVLTTELSAEAEERGAQSARADDLDRQLTEVTGERASAQTLATRLQAQLEAVTARADEITARVTVADTARVEADRNRVSAETNAARLEAQLAGAQDRVAELTTERTTLTADLHAAIGRASAAEARADIARVEARDAAAAKVAGDPPPTD